MTDGPTLVACPDCEGATVSDRGGIESGGCSTCDGTGLVDEEVADA